MDKLLDWISRHPAVDLAPVAVVLLGHALWHWRASNVWTIASVMPDQRSLGYGALATVAALAAGSNNTAVGSYVSSQGPAVDQLRTDHGSTMRRALRSVGLWFWVVATVALVCIVLDPNSAKHPTVTHGADWLAEGATLLLIVKFLRLTLMQDLILKANDLTPARSRQGRTLRRRARPARAAVSPTRPDAGG